MKRFALPLVLLAVALLDVVLIATNTRHEFFGDEWRYVYYAENLLKGFYSPTDRVFLWNGPAYPILIMPFVKANWLDGARYLNVLFHCGALAYAWQVLRPRAGVGLTAVAVLLLGLYPPLFEHVKLIYTEIPCFFLVTGWVSHTLRVERGKRNTVIAGLYFGLLCLTKVIFGYVLVVLGVVMAALWLYERRAMWRSHALEAALAFALCVPYLVYSYDLTGRVFYWSSGGPNSFYWLASTHEGELGDWYHHGWVQKNKLLRKHHKKVFDKASGLTDDPTISHEEQLFNLSTPEASDYLMKVAVANIKKRPLNFVRNWLCNVPRLFFEVPVTVRKVSPFNKYAISSAVLLLATLVAALRIPRPWRRPPRAWWPVILVFVLTMGAYSMSSAVARYLIPVVPMWWLALCTWVFSYREERAAAPLAAEAVAT